MILSSFLSRLPIVIFLKLSIMFPKYNVDFSKEKNHFPFLIKIRSSTVLVQFCFAIKTCQIGRIEKRSLLTFTSSFLVTVVMEKKKRKI